MVLDAFLKGGLIGTVTAVGAAFYAGPVKNAMEWQQQMQNVATLLDGDVKGRVAQLNKEVMNLSNSTGIGTQDLTDGLYQVVSAFGDSADASKQLESLHILIFQAISALQ